jgi:antagonist of KipI
LADVSARVVAGGLQTTVQDLGRAHSQRHAVPVGGAMDTMALRLANLLVGNEENAAALEATLIGPAIEFGAPTLICIGGADLTATVDSTPIGRWRPVLAPMGSTLRFGRPENGCRAYIAFSGGVDVPQVFGSRATYLRGAFGGMNGRALRDGDVIRLGETSALSRRISASLREAAGELGLASWYAGVTLRPPYSAEPIVRLVPGAHTDALDAESRTALFGDRFRVSPSSDRMGYRLEGPQLRLRERVEMLSEAVTFGTVQLPPGGAPIVLMADGQTTGGYPRIGEVASVDLPLMAQLKPGDHVQFAPVSLDDAQRLYLERESELSQMKVGLVFRFSRGQGGDAT